MESAVSLMDNKEAHASRQGGADGGDLVLGCVDRLQSCCKRDVAKNSDRVVGQVEGVVCSLMRREVFNDGDGET